MARNISFALTTPQIIARTKTVTRRMKWFAAKEGDTLCGVKKGMGLKKGEQIERLGLIKVVGVRREPLGRMLDDLAYGHAETTAEGFPVGHELHAPHRFVGFFCEANKCTISAVVTRIEFAYLDTAPG